MEFIRGTTLVYPKIRCWGGEKKASRDRDVKIGTDGNLPPETLLDLGRKKIFPPKALDPMLSKRKAAERACLAVGTRFMGGYAVPDEAVDELVSKLDDIRVSFDTALVQFLSDFEDNKANWLAENSEYEHLIRDQVPDMETVAKTFEFSIKLYKLEPVEGFEPDEEEVADQILHELGQACKQMSDRMIDRRSGIRGNKLVEQLDPFINRLDTLSFGNSRILKVLDEFKTLARSIPDEMLNSEHQAYCHAMTFLSMCADSSKLARIINGDLSIGKVINNLSQTSAPAPTAGTTSNATVAISNGAYF